MPEYEFEETKLTCPKCEKGTVRLVISRKEGKEYKFFRCSEYDCDWNGGFYNQDNDMIDLIENCPSCDGILYLRKGKNGTFLGCSHFPECKQTRKLTEEEIKLIDSRSDENLDKFICEGRDDFPENETAQKSDDENAGEKEEPAYERIVTSLKCPECEKGDVVLVIKTTKDKETKFFRCSEDDCHWNGGFYNRDEIKTDVLEHCPRCNGIVYEKIGRKGPFMACSNFPECRFTRNVELSENEDMEIIEEDAETHEDSSDINEALEDSPNTNVNIETQEGSQNNEDIKTPEENISQENIQESDNQTENEESEESIEKTENEESQEIEQTKNEESEEYKPKADYERFETKLLCPECMEGQVVLIRNMDTGKGFFRCTNNDCDWDGGPYSQPLVQLKHITYCQEKGCKGINYHTEGKFGPYKACTWFSKTGCRPKKKR